MMSAHEVYDATAAYEVYDSTAKGRAKELAGRLLDTLSDPAITGPQFGFTGGEPGYDGEAKLVITRRKGEVTVTIHRLRAILEV